MRLSSRPPGLRGPALFLLVLCLAAAALLSGCAGGNPASPSGTTTFLVDPSGGGDFESIQAALNAASSGDTVLVAPGVYTGASNRDLDFGGQDIVLMASAARESVVIDCEGEGRGFYLHSGESAAAVIDGFVVMNGTAYRGGGAHLDGASPTIRNTVFDSNSADLDGGGIYLGGGASPALTDVTFLDNAAVFSGGGLKSDPDCAPSLSHVEFLRNEAGSGAGASFIFSDDAALFEVTFIENLASSAGGGLFCGGSDVTLDEATFIGNRAREGGGVGLSGSSPAISHATLANNESDEGGGIHCSNASSPTIRTSVIALNLGEGSVFCADEASEPDTRRCCLYGNFVSDAPCGFSDNILYEDPLFCGLAEGDVTLCANSPCLPDGNPWGLRIGNRGEGCADCDSSLSTR